MSTTTTTYMSLPVPNVGSESGPQYATDINTCLTVIDQHNHTAGNGQLIPADGLNIASDLTFGNNNATNLRSSRYYAQSVPLANITDIGCVYVSGVDLYYNDVNGNRIQMTSSGAVNATASGISSGTASAAFSAGTLVVKSSSTSGANIKLQSALLSNSGDLTNFLTLAAPVLASSYQVTLPSIPAAQNFLAIDTSGNISAFAPTSLGITRAMLSAPGQQIANGNSVTTSTGSYVAVSGASVTITTTGNPILIIINGAFSATRAAGGRSGYGVGLGRAGSLYKAFGLTVWYDPVGGATFSASSSYVWMQTESAGTYTYDVRVTSDNSAVTCVGSAVSISAYEIK